jgi:UDP-glucose 4-epimerase
MRKVVVTGGAGFIGSHVVDLFLQNQCEILVIDDLSTGRQENLDAAVKEYSKHVQLAKLDICASETRARVEAFKPELICHLAAQMNVRRSVSEPQFDAEKNIVGTINLLEAAKDCECNSFILASTGGAIYGEQEYFPADENHPILPECPYGISKRAGELYLDYYARTYGLQTRSLRFANVYGPRQNPKGEAGVVAIFSERIIAGQTLTVNGDGGQTRDFIFVRDVAEAVRLVADNSIQTSSKKGTFQIFNVGCSVETSINELIIAMKEASKGIADRPFPAVEHKDALLGEQRRSVITAKKLESDLSWKPQVTLVDGLRATIESFKY